MSQVAVVESVPWLLLISKLPAKQASERVELWRKLRKYGALPLPTSGYLLPNTPENQERFEWVAVQIRRYKGRASVAQLQAIDDLPADKLRQMFIQARSQDYEALIGELRKASRKGKHEPADVTRFRRRLQDVAAIDFFHSPLRGRAETLLERLDSRGESRRSSTVAQLEIRDYLNRIWVTRPRPGIDRVSSAWLIRRFIDNNAQFAFAGDPKEKPGATPFDMFQAGGFGHRGEDCTFETLRKEFAIQDAKVKTIAEAIHDADLGDEKFGRNEAFGIDRILIGWAQLDVADEELLRRGMDMIEGLYYSLD